MPTSSGADGRRARGQARRTALIDAALVVLQQEGLAGLTHRAVAEEAGVPLASASYHFHGIGDLIEQTMRKANDDWVRALAEADLSDRGPAGLARLVADSVNNDRDVLIAEYELYLYTLRAPELRASALEWLDVIAETYMPGIQGVERRAFLALVEGVFLHALMASEPADAGAIEETLRAAWP